MYVRIENGIIFDKDMNGTSYWVLTTEIDCLCLQSNMLHKSSMTDEKRRYIAITMNHIQVTTT